MEEQDLTSFYISLACFSTSLIGSASTCLLLLGQPHVTLRVDGVKALVELKGGPECLQEKSQLPEFQKLLSVLALTL